MHYGSPCTTAARAPPMPSHSIFAKFIIPSPAEQHGQPASDMKLRTAGGHQHCLPSVVQSPVTQQPTHCCLSWLPTALQSLHTQPLTR